MSTEHKILSNLSLEESSGNGTLLVEIPISKVREELRFATKGDTVCTFEIKDNITLTELKQIRNTLDEILSYNTLLD